MLTTLSVPDMTCGNCVAHIRAALAGLPGLANTSIDLPRQQVRFDASDQAVVAAVLARLAADDYPASVVPT